jgi:formylglycine-generating enzyme required for sulfatase activity
MKVAKPVLLTLIFIATSQLLLANNIVISNSSLTGRVLGSHTFVEFDLSWDNSFRLTAGPNNWDAAWVFVKYQITGGTGCTASTVWRHATLSAIDGEHSVGANLATINGVADSRGVFIYRSDIASGTVNWTDLRVRWNYAADGILDACSVTIRVFAMEMVLVPQGSFYCGDGSAGNTGKFEDGTSGTPFLVNSATTPNTLGGGTVGSLGNNNTTGQSTPDDFNDATSRALPSTYPNGFNAYYVMKYEISQEQYAEFLNTLTGTQQSARFPSPVTVGSFFNTTANLQTPQARNGIKCRIAPVGAAPGEFGCDLDDDDTFNETSGDGRFLACNWLSAPDLMAYLDWSGLRPMTELEYEKASRGPLLPIANEFAWGNTTLIPANAISNGGSDNELVTTVNANVSSNNAFSSGPLRSGVFATSTSTRVQAGATYYGIMEMTGNVWEDGVGLGSAAGRSFTGLHGDGSLIAAGAANVDFWPGINGNNTLASPNLAFGGTTGSTGYAGMGFMAGSWREGAYLQVSDRQYKTGWNGLTGRDNRNGGRGVRTAP